MSATMRQELASLLVHKTGEGRTRARRRVEAWQKAIETVQQAEQMAECIINVPTETIQGAQGAALKVPTANYIVAVHLDNKAATERQAIIATATKALQERIEECRRTEKVTQHELQSTISQRDTAIAAAHKSIATAKSKQNFYITYPHMIEEGNSGKELGGEPQSTAFAFAHLLGIMSAVLGVVAFIIFAKDYTMWSLLVFGFFAYLTLLGFAVLRIVMVKGAYRKRKRSLVDTVNATFQQEVKVAEQAAKAAENGLLEMRLVLEENMERAEVSSKKAEDALQWLKAQAVNNAAA